MAHAEVLQTYPISTRLSCFIPIVVAAFVGHPGSLFRQDVETVTSEIVLAGTGAGLDGTLYQRRVTPQIKITDWY